MKNILKKLALLAIPVAAWLAVFIAFEPNNYFGLKDSAGSSQPVARVRAYQQDPGRNLILGDSRLAHFDMDLVAAVSGEEWQNLSFGGASLKETLDLAGYVLDSGHPVDTLLVEVSFYTLNEHYNTDRFSQLEETLENPLAYCLNLEYNVNALTVRLAVVLPPMAQNVRTEVCDVFGITEAMENEVLPALRAWSAEDGFTLLDYEWGGSCITDDDTQFFDGFHLDERYGLPDWTVQLFSDLSAN